MKYVRLVIFSMIAFVLSNIRVMQLLFKVNIAVLVIISVVGAVLICSVPKIANKPTKKLRSLAAGCELLSVFLLSLIFNAVYFTYDMINNASDLRWYYIVGIIIDIFIFEMIVFTRGIVRVYAQSTQLGIKHRVLAVVFAWIPIINIYYLFKMIKIVNCEVKFESDKIILNKQREDKKICQTKYPILLVHGVFFRDFRYLDYWGRIPDELKSNGATIYYGNQQSAESVEKCGNELAERIKQIVAETGCEKVNIIAHSKGGLDSRAAISHCDAGKYVASLTTINTPHQGCIFAEYLLNKIPDATVNAVAKTYNSVLSRLGDKSPDFISAVNDLTNSECIERNKSTADDPEILYESVMSYCSKATNGKFPLNLSYPLVKHFDGLNDGLVSIDSAKWGSDFTLLEPKSTRGISHGDMIDLNRENIDGFDVREFYVQLVAKLKQRGY